MKKRMYKKGYKYYHWKAVIDDVIHDQYVFFNNKLLHPSFIMNWPLRIVINAVTRSLFFRANKTEEK